MKTQYYAASSLDGFIADQEHSLEWLFQFGSTDETSYPEFIRGIGAVAMGSATYEWLLGHHVHRDADAPAPWPYEQPCWVFTSRDLPTVGGADVRFVSGDAASAHRDMREAAGHKNIWIVGGGDLAGQFYDAGLLDEIIVQVTPVTLGGGAPLLPRRIVSPPLRLSSGERYGDAFVELRYDVRRS